MSTAYGVVKEQELIGPVYVRLYQAEEGSETVFTVSASEGDTRSDLRTPDADLAAKFYRIVTATFRRIHGLL